MKVSFTKCIQNFFQTILNSLRKVFEKQEQNCQEEQECNEETVKKEKLTRTLMARLYSLEQEIAIFEKEFPNEYEAFGARIKSLQEKYHSALQEIKKTLTFAINPEEDMEQIMQVTRLEKDISKFLRTEVKFRMLSNKLQKLIVKLNILYNVSIYHSKSSEEQKVISQLERAIKKQGQITAEVKQSDYILQNKQIKERILELIAYADYLIFKAKVRNTNQITGELIEKMTILVEFDEFDYVKTFKDFIIAEAYDLLALLEKISDKQCKEKLQQKGRNILTSLTFLEKIEQQLWNPKFWSEILEFESNVIQILKAEGMSKEDAKVKLIDRMAITVEEDDVLTSPITNAYLAIAPLYTATCDERILLLLKLFKNLSQEVTYKEIYFLVLLFEAEDLIRAYPNDLWKKIERYHLKYAYEQSTILEKKQRVIRNSSKEYIVAFSEIEDDNDILKIIPTLIALNLDFKVVRNKVLLNSSYFRNLKSVLNSLTNNE